MCTLYFFSETPISWCNRYFKKYFRKRNVLKIDLEELEKYIFPKYHEIASSISEQKANIGENYQQLTTSLNKWGREWHRRIDNIIKGLRSNINEIESKHPKVLNKHEDEITNSISEID